MITIEPLTAARAGAWAELFEASSSACFCRYWHFEGDKNAWLLRCATTPDQNRQEQVGWLAAGDDRAQGLVAMRGDTCVGWLKLTPRASVPKLRRLPVYRTLNLGDDEGVWSIGCLLVRPDARGEGTSNALISAAPEHAKLWGARAVEAYPHVQTVDAADEQMWRGVISSYERAGFVHVAGELPYPVLRHPLGDKLHRGS